MSERRTPPSVFKKAGAIAVAFFMVLIIAASFQPVEATLTWPVAPAVQVNTTTTTISYPGKDQGSCSYGSYFYAFWVVFGATAVLDYSSSSNGITWSTPTAALTLTSMGTIQGGPGIGGTIQYQPFQIVCDGNVVLVGWQTVNGGAAAGANVQNFFYYSFSTLGQASIPGFVAGVNGPLSANGNAIKNAYAGTFTFGCLGYYNGHVWYCTQSATAGGAYNYEEDNINVANLTLDSGFQAQLLYNGANYLLYSAHGCKYQVSGDGITWPGFTTIAAAQCTAAATVPNSVGTTAGSNFYLPTIKSAASGWIVQVNNGGLVTNNYEWCAAAGCASQNLDFITTDNQGNFVLVAGAASTSLVDYVFTANTWTSFSAIQTFYYTGTQGTWPFALDYSFSPTLEAFGLMSVSTANPYLVYETILGVPNTAISTGQTLTIGSCPAKDTSTTTLANNTEYFWTTSYFNNAIISNLQTEVASVNSGHVASENLYVAIYFTANAGGVSASNPLLLAGFKTYTLTATSTPESPPPWAASLSTNLPTGSTLGIALLGNSKIVINNSLLSGMFTATTSNGLPNNVITSLTTTNTQLFFCGTMSYQSIATTTVTSTTTSTVTGGGTATTTVSTTTTLTSLTSNAALGNSVGIAFVLLILLAPAFAIAIPLGVYTHSPIGAGLGFVSGLAIGALLGNQGGLIPFSVLAGMMVVIILLIVGFIFALRGSGG